VIAYTFVLWQKHLSDVLLYAADSNKSAAFLYFSSRLIDIKRKHWRAPVHGIQYCIFKFILMNIAIFLNDEAVTCSTLPYI